MSLTDITKYFDRNSKKGERSDNSNQEESSKKLKDGSLNTSRAGDIPDEIFTESLKSLDCVNILFIGIKIVESPPLILKIFNNKTRVILFLIRKLVFLSYVLLFTILLLIFRNCICHFNFLSLIYFFRCYVNHEW